jgi:predicted DNA-binding transcriptional regulator YafY
MKADRLLSALLLLQAHGRLTGRELARRLEVSMRTVHRDMEALSAAGVPVFALRGSRGGWQLDEDWRTQVPGLDESELRALLMAQPRVVGDTRLAAAAERALGKLMAALPASLREQAASMRKRLYVDSTGWNGATEDLAALPVVQDAVSRDRKLEIRYRRGGEEPSLRSVDPLGLVAKGTAWYLVADTADGLRTFRVSRIAHAKLLDKPCARPRDFDLGEYWHASIRRLQDGRPRYDATLRVEADMADQFRRWGATRESDAVDPAGRVTLHVRFDDEEQARFIALGSRADVVGPAALRARVQADRVAGVASGA